MAQEKRGVGNKLLAEFLGSAAMVVAAISPTILAHDVLQAAVPLAVLFDSLAVAFVLFALIESFGPISGCHINPAVTIAMMTTGGMDVRTGIQYMIVQIAGGLVGTISSHLMFYHLKPVLFTVSSIERPGGCYFAEFLGTFLLLTTIYACAKNDSKLTSLAAGLLVGGLLLTTSSTMFANPQVTIARMFTYAIAGIRPIDALFFIVSEVLGAIMAAGVSAKLFLKKT